MINESGMRFISDNAFYIEKSEAYAQLGECVKSVEFVRAMENKLLFIEAKSSFPNPRNPAPNPEKGNKKGFELFDEGIIDICDKFTHSLNLYSAIKVGATESGFPSDYSPSERVTLQFFLVINGFEMSWCEEIARALEIKMRESICMDRIWKPEIYVINHEIARDKNLIST